MPSFQPLTQRDIDDQSWDTRYPSDLQQAAEFHFAPLSIVEHAAAWLADTEAASILDIGAGAGKFCVRAAELHPHAQWVGVELRARLVREAQRWIDAMGLDNCQVYQGEATESSLAGFTGVFIYNPFYEATDPKLALDAELVGGHDSYAERCVALRQNLSHVPRGFRLVSYFCYGPELPDTLQRVWEAADGKLIGWVMP